MIPIIIGDNNYGDHNSSRPLPKFGSGLQFTLFSILQCLSRVVMLHPHSTFSISTNNPLAKKACTPI